MDVQQEIAKRVGKLPPAAQEQVLRYVTSLAPAGKKGSELLQFSGTLDPLCAKEMIEAIEEGCERIDARDCW